MKSAAPGNIRRAAGFSPPMAPRWMLVVCATLSLAAAPVSAAFCLSHCLGSEASAPAALAACHQAGHPSRGSGPPTKSERPCGHAAFAVPVLASAGAVNLPAPAFTPVALAAIAVPAGAAAQAHPLILGLRTPASVRSLTALRI